MTVITYNIDICGHLEMVSQFYDFMSRFTKYTFLHLPFPPRFLCSVGNISATHKSIRTELVLFVSVKLK